jgi:hypothetical protein
MAFGQLWTLHREIYIPFSSCFSFSFPLSTSYEFSGADASQSSFPDNSVVVALSNMLVAEKYRVSWD